MTTALLQKRADRGGPAQPLLRVDGLRKHFPIGGGLFGRKGGAVHAVDDISFRVEKREILGVVGESGCGKSTTARLLSHLIAPDAGSIIFDGEGVGDPGGMSVRELRHNLQMVFQDSFASLNPRMTIVDSVAFGLKVHGMAEAPAVAAARDMLDRVGLDHRRFAGRYPHEVSGGQRQRVNIARALVTRPRMVILDEAVSALDKSIQAQVLNLLLDLKAELDLTYIFISHDLNVVQYISDRVMVMYLGQIVEIGPVDSLYGGARHPYTRALLSAVPSMEPGIRTSCSPLSGDPPNPVNPPPGCRFHDRCPHAEPLCSRVVPALIQTAAGHFAACHMADPASGHGQASPKVPS